MRRLALCACFIVLACGEDPPPEAACRAGTPGEVTPLATVQGSEGIAFSPSGRLFVSSGDRVLEISRDGTVTEFASVPKTLGLAWWGDALYVAAGDDGSGSEGSFCSATRKGAVWKITESGEASVFASVPEPNFLAPTPWGTLLVSNDCTANRNIYEVTRAGEVSVWNDDVPSANGMVFDLDGLSLFVVSTFTSPAEVWRIPVSDGKSGEATSIGSFDGGAPDGVALDAKGQLYIARNTSSEIHRRALDGQISLFAQEPMTPASLAFGEGAFDPCSLYVTSLLGTEIVEVYVGERGRSPIR